jgi:uncharacterized membrane protein
MELQILIGLLLTVLPIVELRGGLPVVVEYCLRNQINIWPYFALVIILNVLVIFVLFLFLDFLHERLMNWNFYRRVMSRYLEKIQRKSLNVQKKFDDLGYIALALFVAIPLPGTGAWTGTFVAWVLGLSRWKSILAISIGVLIAGFLVLLASLGIFGGLY